MNESPPKTPSAPLATSGPSAVPAAARSSWWALLLLVPVPTVGAVVGLHLDPGPVGRAVWMACKVWLVAFPLVWWFVFERGSFSWSPMRHGGWKPGVITGLGFAAAILLGPSLVPAAMLDPEALRQLAAQSGFDTKTAFIALAIGLSFGNALIEEVIWRWFVFVKAEPIFGRRHRYGAVVASGLFFTLHHVVVLAAYFPPTVVVLGSLGVFLGGCTWSALYLRYRSVWPGYLSHVLADLAIFLVGWNLLFG